MGIPFMRLTYYIRSAMDAISLALAILIIAYCLNRHGTLSESIQFFSHDPPSQITASHFPRRLCKSPTSSSILNHKSSLNLLQRRRIILPLELEVHLVAVVHAVHLGLVKRSSVGVQRKNHLA